MVKVAPYLLPKISGVEVTPSVTSAESSEQFWHQNTPNLTYLRTLQRLKTKFDESWSSKSQEKRPNKILQNLFN